MNENQDEQYLKYLSIFHYVVGGLAGLFACFPIIHLIAGIFIMVAGFADRSAGGPPVLIGLLFVLIGGSLIVAGWAFAICVILAGVFLTRRKNYMFCLVMAGIQCMFTPFGTVLGVFTIITLVRPSVKEMFDANAMVAKAA